MKVHGDGKIKIGKDEIENVANLSFLDYTLHQRETERERDQDQIRDCKRSNIRPFSTVEIQRP